MKDTNTVLESSSQTTPATTPAKNTSMPVIDMDQAKLRLSIVAEDAYQFNKRTGGKMTMHATDKGVLVIVASLPYHRLGVATIDSGTVITIDGVPVE